MALGSASAFRPTGTVSITAGTTSNSVILSGGGETIVVTNTSAALAFVRFGADPSVTASSADMPVLPNARVVLSVNSFVTYGAVLLGSGTGVVMLTRGDGAFV